MFCEKRQRKKWFEEKQLIYQYAESQATSLEEDRRGDIWMSSERGHGVSWYERGGGRCVNT